MLLRTVSVFVVGSSLAIGCGGSSESGNSGGTGATGGNAGNGGASGSAGSGGGSGSTGSGGAAGKSGAGGTSGAGGGGLGAECITDSDCRMFADCCSCIGLAPGEAEPPSCNRACEQDRCGELGLDASSVRCAAGRCVAGFSCAGDVACDRMPPICQPGSTPSIVGACWGPCVQATECASVGECSACTGQLESCVTYVARLGPTNHCIQLPKGCEASPTCACIGESVCVGAFSNCADKSGLPGVACDCPSC
jgi:hypothetical protein